MILYNDIDFKKPKSLFKFTKISEYTYSSLLNKTVFLAKATDLNDPFEFDIDFDAQLSEEEKAFIKNSNPNICFSDIENILEQAKNNLNGMLTRNRILSLSSNPYELLMWSHYADEHKGICIEYDRHNCELLGDERLCKRVIYPQLKDKTTIKLLPFILGGNKDPKLSETILFARKAYNWEYENEWRLVLEDTKAINTQLLNDSIKIKSITFGLRTPSHHKLAIYNLVEKFYEEDILFYQTIKSNQDIAVEIIKFNPNDHIELFMAPKFKL